MNLRNRFGRACLLILVLAIAPLRAAQSGYDLYQQALVKERAAGDVDAAIRLYERVTKEFASDRELVAKALFRMAECYNRLASPEAEQLYARVVRDFSEQREVAAEAGARLEALRKAVVPQAPPPPGLLKLTRTLAGHVVDVPDGVPSPNGKSIALATQVEVSIRDIASGRTRPLTRVGLSENICNAERVWSRDSQWIAFSVCTESASELRAVSLAGETKVLATAGTGSIDPLDWTPDGTQVLVLISKSGSDTNQLALVSLSNRSSKTLKTGSAGERWPKLRAARVSPDARFIVYTPEDRGDEKGGLMVLFTDGSGRESALPEATPRDQLLGFTPNGRKLVVFSDRMGTQDIWLLPFADGKASGIPAKVVTDVGPISTAFGLTDNGEFYYRGEALTNRGVTDLYLAPLDQAGKIAGTPQLVARSGSGHLTFPVWSPSPGDRQLSYKVSVAGQAGYLHIMSLATGVERRVEADLGSAIGQFDWSHDGRWLVVACKRGEIPRLERVDVKTGEVSLIRSANAEEAALSLASPGQGALSQPRWLPDNRSILFVNTARLLRRDVDSGEERVVFDAGSPIQSFAVSPDGRSIAFVSAGELRVATLADGKPRVVAPSVEGTSAKRVAWSADSQFVIFADRTADARVPGTSLSYSELWRYPVNGGKGERMGLAADSLLQPAPSPDGRYIAFSVNSDASTTVHVLDRFLSPSDFAQNNK